MRWGRRPVWLMVALLSIAACGGDDQAEPERGGTGSVTVAPAQAAASSTTTGSTAPPGPPAPLPPVASLQGVALTAVQISPVETLTAMAWRPGDPDPYIADQHGVVYHVVGGTSEPVLDLTAKVMDWKSGAE